MKMEPPPGVFTYINLIDLVQMVIVVMLLCCTLKTEPPTLVFAYMNLIDLVKVVTVLMVLVP